MAKTQVLVLFLLWKLLPLALCTVIKPFPCFFIFGDSLVDAGNNNNLNTSTKADYFPYGVDFPSGPTGRFTNGLTTADILAQMLGFDDFIPPFAAEQGRDAINGVNYASGSAGIRSESGQQLGARISLDQQLLNHEVTLSRLAVSLGNISSAKHHLNKCLYYIVVGSNDYINNYFKPDFFPTSKLYSPLQYASVLIKQYSQQLKKLYGLGARKIAVAGLGPIGCIPAMKGGGGGNEIPCVHSVNKAVRLFNDRLILLVDELNNDISEADVIYISAMDLRPAELFVPGLRLVGDPCCNVTSNTGLCTEGRSPCNLRALHFFYDDFHPTEIVNRIVATASYIDILKLIS